MTGGSRSIRRQSCPGASYYTKNPTGAGLGICPVLGDERRQLKDDGTFGEATPEKFICVLTVRHRLSNKLNSIPYRLAIAKTLGQIQSATFAKVGQVHTEIFSCGSDN